MCYEQREIMLDIWKYLDMIKCWKNEIRFHALLVTVDNSYGKSI